MEASFRIRLADNGLTELEEARRLGIRSSQAINDAAEAKIKGSSDVGEKIQRAKEENEQNWRWGFHSHN